MKFLALVFGALLLQELTAEESEPESAEQLDTDSDLKKKKFGKGKPKKWNVAAKEGISTVSVGSTEASRQDAGSEAGGWIKKQRPVLSIKRVTRNGGEKEWEGKRSGKGNGAGKPSSPPQTPPAPPATINIDDGVVLAPTVKTTSV